MGRKHGSSRTRYSSLVWLAHPVLLESALPCSCTHYLEHFLCCLPSCSWLITPANSGRSLSLLYVTAVSSVTADFGHLLVGQALIPCRTSAASSILLTLLLVICPRLGNLLLRGNSLSHAHINLAPMLNCISSLKMANACAQGAHGCTLSRTDCNLFINLKG